MSDLFVFSMVYVARRDDPYFYTRWDIAKPIEVVAPTKQEAINKAESVLGNAGSHYHWVFHVKSIRDALIPASNQEGQP